MTKAVSQITFKHLDAALVEVARHSGNEGVEAHLMTLAYGLGAQMGVLVEPSMMPDAINAILERLTKGIEVGMRETHGIENRFETNVVRMQRSAL